MNAHLQDSILRAIAQIVATQTNIPVFRRQSAIATHERHSPEPFTRAIDQKRMRLICLAEDKLQSIPSRNN
ncbi:MAG: hypothetical protein WA947_12625 [Phormidesmis sp.]